MSSTITITRAERDRIHEHIGYWAPGVTCMDSVPFGTRDEALDSIAKLRFAIAVYDELGWSDDDPRQSFTLTVRPEIAERLRSIRDDAAYSVSRDLTHREKALNGDRDHWFVGYKTLEEVIEQYDRQLSEYRDERRMCEDLLARLDHEAVTA